MDKETVVKKEKIKRAEKNGVSRPNAGTQTGNVWIIADKLSSKTNSPATRKDVLAQAEKDGINKSTATTQYGLWRKFHGLSKEVPEAKEKAVKEPEKGKAPAASLEDDLDATLEGNDNPESDQEFAE